MVDGNFRKLEVIWFFFAFTSGDDFVNSNILTDFKERWIIDDIPFAFQILFLCWNFRNLFFERLFFRFHSFRVLSRNFLIFITLNILNSGNMGSALLLSLILPVKSSSNWLPLRSWVTLKGYIFVRFGLSWGFQEIRSRRKLEKVFESFFFWFWA